MEFKIETINVYSDKYVRINYTGTHYDKMSKHEEFNDFMIKEYPNLTELKKSVEGMSGIIVRDLKITQFPYSNNYEHVIYASIVQFSDKYYGIMGNEIVDYAPNPFIEISKELYDTIDNDLLIGKGKYKLKEKEKFTKSMQNLLNNINADVSGLSKKDYEQLVKYFNTHYF